MITQLAKRCRRWLGEPPVELSLDLFEEQCHRGDEVRGRVRILSNCEVRILSVTVTLVDWRISGEQEPAHRLKLADDLMVSPLQPQSLVFRISIPDIAPLSKVTSGCRLEARAALTGGRELMAIAHPYVLPHREAYAILTAFGNIGFRPTSLNKENSPGVLTSRFEPLNSESGIRWVDLALRVKESVTGSLEVAKETGGKPGDYRADFTIPRDLLLTDDRNLNPDPAIPYLNRALADALLEPEDPARRLLRAAAGPNGEGLLRPAENGSTVDLDSLLRPEQRSP